ncbi:hypothetical protein [Marinomonas polaris]|uniref:hypothetical protein n=1 Tax=Marinomonas polaris TaxID=293552 RepID=UPI003F97BF98
MPYDATMTKKDRKNAARELIRRYAIGERFISADRERFGELCGYNFEWVERVLPKQGNAPAVYVFWSDEEYTGSWSWVKSIDGYDKR